jgi:hypothetical protein
MDKAQSFKPDAILYVAHLRETDRAAWYLAEVVSKGIPVPYAGLNEILRRAGVTSKSSRAIAERRLLPFKDEILAWTYRGAVEECRKQGFVPLLAFVPQLEKTEALYETPLILDAAREAGFVVLDLSDVFEGHDISTLWLSEFDTHPNPKGHRLIADRLYELLDENAGQIFPAERVALNARNAQ